MNQKNKQNPKKSTKYINKEISISNNKSRKKLKPQNTIAKKQINKQHKQTLSLLKPKYNQICRNLYAST